MGITAALWGTTHLERQIGKGWSWGLFGAVMVLCIILPVVGLLGLVGFNVCAFLQLRHMHQQKQQITEEQEPTAPLQRHE